MNESRKKPAGWRWRRGALLVGGLAALAAGALGLASAGVFGRVPQLPSTDALGQAASAAAAFAAVLLGSWALLDPSRRGADLPRPAGSRVGLVQGGLAAAAVSTGIVLAARNLDFPLRVDESETIVRYVAQPFAVAASDYGAVNNHVLHTLLAWVAHQVGGWNRVVLRMPAFLSFCLLLPALWWFAKREYGRTAATFATTLAATSPYIVNVATSARGYTLMMLFAVASLLCGQALVRRPTRGGSALWAAWAATVGLGLFTIPLMAWSAATTVIWMLLARRRRCGGDEPAWPFLARTAAWSAAAVVLAGVLYAPALASTAGVTDSLIGRAVGPLSNKLAVDTLEDVVRVWRDWHAALPAWAGGALLALVLVGAAVPGRSCGRRGTFLPAVLAAPALLCLTKPFPQAPRFAVATLLLLTISAGAGAALVLERVVARTRSRWPGGGAPSLANVQCGTVVLLLVALTWAASRPGVASRHGYLGGQTPGYPVLQQMIASVEGQMRSGDYFAASNGAHQAIAYAANFHEIEAHVGRYPPVPNARGWPVHQLSPSSDAPSVPAPDGRFFLFDPEDTRAPSTSAVSMAREHLEAYWPGYEVVAHFAEGPAYLVNGWTGAPH